ncbi:TetR/AcrR family transcriptional regulator [Chitinimonas sp. JJ19]|uniref:TetR/AcrR family transcriptional regulator n=1 Tax=Chitinimonas sp. JJ19 TaxID=3109352 RepID=UPI003003727A
MKNTTERRQRGRPRDPERMRRLLEAARVHFLAQGYERASLDAIAQASGVSKMTIYSYFPSKQALFEAVVGARTDGAFEQAPTQQLDPRQPAESLRSIARQFLGLVRHESVRAHFRMMEATLGQQPEASMAFFQEGPDKAISMVAQYLAQVDAAGVLRIPQPRLAADLFLAMLQGESLIRLQLGLPALDASYLADQLEEAVQMMLCRYAPN